MSLKGKTVFITGGSRGIGKAMALKLAAAGANIVIAAKSVEEDPRLGGTIFTAAAEVEALGVKALAVQVDIRDEAQIANAVKLTVEKFGGIDILINNASAPKMVSGGGRSICRRLPRRWARWRKTRLRLANRVTVSRDPRSLLRVESQTTSERRTRRRFGGIFRRRGSKPLARAVTIRTWRRGRNLWRSCNQHEQ